MKRLRLLITEPAGQDLRGIRAWLRREAGSKATGKVLSQIEGLVARLRLWPLTGVAQPDLGQTIRCCSVGSYVIYYTADAADLTVMRVLHASQDRTSIMRGSPSSRVPPAPLLR